MSIRPLTTERLILAPLTLADAPAIQARFPVWAVVRWMDGGIPWPYPDDGAETYVAQIALPAMAAGEAWHWTLREKTAPDTLIGALSLMDKPDDNRGFWLAPSHQGRGLMTEASAAATDFWFEALDRPVLRAPKAVANIASRRVSERQGMRVVGAFRKALVCGECDMELWEITQAEWRARRPGLGRQR